MKIRKVTKTFRGSTFSIGVMVYVWWRDNKALYVGKSSIGTNRIFSNHHIINKKEKVQDDDVFETHFLYDLDWNNNTDEVRKEATRLEIELIRKLKPKYNTVHLKGAIIPGLLPPPKQEDIY